MEIIGIVMVIGCMYVAHKEAPKRGRSAFTWTILALFFNVFALIALFLLPKK